MKSKKTSIYTMTKKEESLSEKIKLMIGEQIDMLNNDFFNQKLESLQRRVEQVQCKKAHEETAKTFLKKVSKLESHLKAVVAFQQEAFSKMAVHQAMLPSADYQNTVLNQPGPSAFCPGMINIATSSSNTLLLLPYTGFTSAHASQYTSSDEVLLVSMENQNIATSDNSAIPNNQMSTQAEMSATVQSEIKERKRKMNDVTEEKHNCRKDFEAISISSSTAKILPRIPLFPELAEEFKDPPQNPETEVAYVQDAKGTALPRTLTETDPKSASLHSLHLYLLRENLTTIRHHAGRKQAKQGLCHFQWLAVGHRLSAQRGHFVMYSLELLKNPLEGPDYLSKPSAVVSL